MLQDFLVNLLASLFFVLAGYYLRQLQQAFHVRRTYSFWKPLLNDSSSVYVILTTKKGPYSRSTLRVSFNEALAFAELSILFKEFKVPLVLLGGNTEVEQLKDRHLVILGGPNSNAVAEKV
jgi:hypothetical protein